MRVEAGLEGRSGRLAGEPIEVVFGTGAPVETDVSGSWLMTIENAQIRGELELGLLQARGGQVSGAMTENHGEIEFDHVEGYMSGSTLIFDPFLADTPFGELLVERAELQMIDDDNDGYADRGAGTLSTLIELPVTARRLSLPRPSSSAVRA